MDDLSARREEVIKQEYTKNQNRRIEDLLFTIQGYRSKENLNKLWNVLKEPKAEEMEVINGFLVKKRYVVS